MSEIGQVIVIGSQKGGVGKSTLAINIAAGLKNKHPNKTVKLIDADSGRSTTRWYQSRVDYDEYLEKLNHPPLSQIMFDYFDFNKSIARKLQDERKIIDFIVVDTGGFSVENKAFESAYLSASSIYIPYTPDRFDLASLVPTLSDVRELEERLAEQIESQGFTHVDKDVRVIMNKADRSRGREAITEARELVSDLVGLCSLSSVEVPLLNSFKTATSEGLSVYEVESGSASNARAVIDLLVDEILGERPLKKTRGLKK